MKITLALPTITIRPISWPHPNFSGLFKKIINLPTVLFDSLPITYGESKFRSPSLGFSSLRFRRFQKDVFKWGLGILAVVLTIGGMLFFLSQSNKTVLGTAKTAINKSFQITERDKDGKSLNKTGILTVLTAEKLNSVLIQGKRYKASEGKQFLLLTFELDNLDKTVYYANPLDLVRYIRSDGKKFAPTVHQGLTSVRADSTKNSNVGFVVNNGDNNFNIEVGELDGQRETLEIKF